MCVLATSHPPVRSFTPSTDASAPPIIHQRISPPSHPSNPPSGHPPILSTMELSADSCIPPPNRPAMLASIHQSTHASSHPGIDPCIPLSNRRPMYLFTEPSSFAPLHPAIRQCIPASSHPPVGKKQKLSQSHVSCCASRQRSMLRHQLAVHRWILSRGTRPKVESPRQRRIAKSMRERVKDATRLPLPHPRRYNQKRARV